MKNPRRNLAIDKQRAKPSHVDPALQAANIRALIWEKLQDPRLCERLQSTTFKDLRQSLTLAVTTALGLTEYEMVRLLRQHGAH